MLFMRPQFLQATHQTLIHFNVLKMVSDLKQVSGFLSEFNKTGPLNIAEILFNSPISRHKPNMQQ
jgi:hypothetical protein